MALPSSTRQMSNASIQNHLLRAGAPVTFNILKERLKSTGSSGNSSQKENQNQSPFVSSPFGHPGFLPQKIGKSTSAETRVSKPPKPPEKPLMPYMRYSRKVWDQVKVQNPESKLWEIGKIIGQMWRDLPPDDKTEFIEEYEAEKVEYEKSLKLYYSSPAYLAYIAAKTKGKSALQSEDRDSHDRSSGASKQDRRIEIQPAEDDDDAEESYSVKHLSYARYLRNHHLIHEIFSDSVVPDVRSVVTSSRMQNFYCKIQSLKMHQKKMESEVEQLIEKFEATKRKLSDASDAFQEEIRKYCKRAVDEEHFNEMVEKEYERLRRERYSTNNNNITLDEGKKAASQPSPASAPSPNFSEEFSDTLGGSSLVEEVTIDPKEGGNQGEQVSKETFLAPPPPVQPSITFHSPTQLSSHPQVNYTYSQNNFTSSQNQMPPPPQPFSPSPQSHQNIPNTHYSYPVGLPPCSSFQNARRCFPTFPYQQHHQQQQPVEFAAVSQTENRDDLDDNSSIVPE